MSSQLRAGEPSDAVRSINGSEVKLVFLLICIVWYFVVAFLCITGTVQLCRHYSSPRRRKQWGKDAPEVTIIRPIKGLEPCLYECLASTFRQSYPHEKTHIRLCISDRQEPSLPTLERLIRDFPTHDAQILIEEEDEVLTRKGDTLGPNPKIRNMSRAYREAKGDIVWIIDCNVWVASGVCDRMVWKLSGEDIGKRYKFVHQLPLVVDVFGHPLKGEDQTNSVPAKRNIWSIGGGRLEEIFMSSAHAKFYTAINTVLIAPCIVGKSTMFRRSHLDSLTQAKGIDFFSDNICEDHLIGDSLWKQQIPAEKRGEKWGKHALCFGDLAIQPMASMSLGEYWNRRVRWLRVRKFTVTLATLVEPGTESFLCSLYGAYIATNLPFFHSYFGIPPTWSGFASFWLINVTIWCLMDRALYLVMQSGASIECDADTPSFARPPGPQRRRPFGEWLLAWLGRESLALPIWLWAFYGGTTVQWRGNHFWVGMDMKVHRIHDTKQESSKPDSSGLLESKARQD